MKSVFKNLFFLAFLGSMFAVSANSYSVTCQDYAGSGHDDICFQPQ